MAQSQTFTPRLALEYASRYNDNLLISPAQKKEDFSEVLSPGVGFLYGQPQRTYISLDYLAELERFNSFREFDANNEYVKLDTQAKFDRLTMRLMHSFHDVAGPNSEISMWARERRNETTLNSEYRLNSKTSMGLDCRQLFNDYVTTGMVNSRKFIVGGTLYYHLFPKTDLLGQFNHGWVNVQSGANAVYEEVNVGFRGQLTGKIVGIAKVGYQHREFDLATVATLNEPVAAIDLEAKLTDRISVNIEVARDIEPSGSQLNDSYSKTDLSLAGHYRLFRSVTLSAGGLYSDHDYKKEYAGYVLTCFDAWVGVNYEMTKWLQLGAYYRYEMRSMRLSARGSRTLSVYTCASAIKSHHPSKKNAHIQSFIDAEACRSKRQGAIFFMAPVAVVDRVGDDLLYDFADRNPTGVSHWLGSSRRRCPGGRRIPHSPI